MRNSLFRGAALALVIGVLSIAGQACEDAGRDQAPLEPQASEPQQQQEQTGATGETQPPSQQSGGY